MERKANYEEREDNWEDFRCVYNSPDPRSWPEVLRKMAPGLAAVALTFSAIGGISYMNSRNYSETAQNTRANYQTMQSAQFSEGKLDADNYNHSDRLARVGLPR